LELFSLKFVKMNIFSSDILYHVWSELYLVSDEIQCTIFIININIYA